MLNCVLCSKIFKYKSKYDEHKNRKNPCVSSIILNCEHCKVKFKCNAEKIRHEKTLKHTINSGLIKENNIEIKNKYPIIGYNSINKEYIYILTNKNKENDCIYKVGRTKNLKSRLSAYNTGRVDKEIHYYVSTYECINASQLEKLILVSLSKFTIGNEIVQIEYEKLNNFIKNICDNMKLANNQLNN